MKRVIGRLFRGLLCLSLVFGLAGWAYLQLPKFGALPEGHRLERIAASPNYRDGEFRNLDPIPERTGNVISGWTRMLLTQKDRPQPDRPVPFVKTDLLALDKDRDLIIWLGHSSYLIQSEGLRYLVDPVLDTHAAPIPLANRAFPGTSVYSVDDLPPVDYLIITHDHWDHLDYYTVKGMREKVGLSIVPLGVGAHLERWGYPADRVRELDWDERLDLREDVSVHALPALHYSGRLLTRNKTLWAAYAITGPARNIYIGGDSGYGSHFAMAGRAFGGFDLAVLDAGQYNEAWRWVHMMPEETARAAIDLRAGMLMPVHMGKFSMSYHSWDDPFIRMVAASHGQPYGLVMPLPGEVVSLNELRPHLSRWWEPDQAGPESFE